MENNNKNQPGIVIESYNDTPDHRIIIVQTPDDFKSVYFFYIQEYPKVDFGDVLLMNFADDAFFIYHGNPRLRYKIIPLPFPGSLLLELIAEQLLQ